MKFLLRTYSRPLVVEAKVKTFKPQKIRVKAYPVNEFGKPFPNTVYTNRYATIVGEETFFIKMPKTTEYTVIQIYNEAWGDLPKGQDRTFTVLSLKKKTLPTQLFVFEYTNPVMASFVDFAEKFALKCGYLSSGIYYSPDALFRIDYHEGQLKATDKNGRIVISNTPARIGAETAIVEVSKEKFDKYTTAGRFIILLHEFCHFYKNKNMRDEEEADYYAINIALGKGYPEVELLLAFAEIFKNADNPGNRKRYEKIKKYVDNFPYTVKRKKELIEEKE